MSWKYSPEEEAFIVASYGKIHDKELAEKLGRTLVAIQKKRKELGLTRDRYQLAKHAKCYELRVAGYTYKEIGDIVGITKQSVFKFIKKFLPYVGNRPVTITLQSKFNYETNGTLTEQSVETEDYSVV